LSTHLAADRWTVELRLPNTRGTLPFRGSRAGETLSLPGGAMATLLAPYAPSSSKVSGRAASAVERAKLPNGKRYYKGNGQTEGARLWIATLALPSPLLPYLERYGFPIRYSYVREGWPSSYYQTVYVTEPGSAEMPSAGRAFTPELLTQLVARGVQIAPLLLHTGVASLEDHEPPYAEEY